VCGRGDDSRWCWGPIGSSLWQQGFGRGTSKGGFAGEFQKLLLLLTLLLLQVGHCGGSSQAGGMQRQREGGGPGGG